MDQPSTLRRVPTGDKHPTRCPLNTAGCPTGLSTGPPDTPVLAPLCPTWLPRRLQTFPSKSGNLQPYFPLNRGSTEYFPLWTTAQQPSLRTCPGSSLQHALLPFSPPFHGCSTHNLPPDECLTLPQPPRSTRASTHLSSPHVCHCWIGGFLIFILILL